MSEEQSARRCIYKKISEEVRKEIIERILQKGQDIKDVSREMNVNISTCKAILKVYQEEGRVGKKKNRNKVYNVVETFTFYTIKHSALKQVGDTLVEESKVSLERNEDFDKFLEDNSKSRAENLLQQAVEQSKKDEEETASHKQAQLMQFLLMRNGYIQYYSPSDIHRFPQGINPQEHIQISQGSSGSNASASIFSRQLRQK